MCPTNYDLRPLNLENLSCTAFQKEMLSPRSLHQFPPRPNTTLPTNSLCVARKAESSRTYTRPTSPARSPALWTACSRPKTPRVRPSTVSVGPAFVHSSRHASHPPSTGESMAPSAFDSGEVATGVALTSDTPTPRLHYDNLILYTITSFCRTGLFHDTIIYLILLLLCCTVL